MLPQVNATLSSVQRGGYSEDYDRPAGGAPMVWQGSVDAYVQQKIVSAFNQAGELRRILQTTLILSSDLSGSISGGLQAGDTVTCQVGNPDNPSTLVGRIQNIINPANLPVIQDYYKCALEEISAQ